MFGSSRPSCSVVWEFQSLLFCCLGVPVPLILLLWISCPHFVVLGLPVPLILTFGTSCPSCLVFCNFLSLLFYRLGFLFSLLELPVSPSVLSGSLSHSRSPVRDFLSLSFYRLVLSVPLILSLELPVPLVLSFGTSCVSCFIVCELKSLSFCH